MFSAPAHRRSLGSVVAWLTFVMLLGSVALNLLQANRLRAFTEAKLASLPLGAVAPPIRVSTLAGAPVDLSFAGRPTILYYFSPKCAWCERNWLNVKALAAALAGRYRVVGLSTSSDVAAYVQERGLSFEIYAGLTPDLTRAYYLGGTPHTVVISAAGRVERNWAGAYTPRVQREIEQAFGITLPGLSMPGTLAR